MQKILEQIFNGEFCPNERTRVYSDEYEATRKAAIQAHDAFEDKLCQSLKEERYEWFSKESDISSYYSTQTFIDGFKLGARLMLEIMEVGKDG